MQKRNSLMKSCSSIKIVSVLYIAEDHESDEYS